MLSTHWPLTILNSFVSCLQIALPLVLVRVFSAEQIGDYKVFFLYTALLPLLSFSIGFSHGQAFWMGKGDARRLIGQSWSLLLSWCVLLLLAGLFLIKPLTPVFRNSGFQTVAFMASAISAVLIAFAEDSWVVHGKIWQVALYRGAMELVRSLLMLAVGIWFRDINIVLAVHALVMLVRLCVCTVVSLKQGIFTLTFDRGAVREVYRYAAPVSIAGFLGAISGSTDQILLSNLLSRADFAVFAMGCLVVPPVYALETSVNQVLAFKLSAALFGGDKAKAESLLREGMIELFRFLVPCAFGLFIFAEPIVRIIYTDAYLASVPVMRLFAFSYILSAVPHDIGAKASGDGGYNLRAFAWKSLVSISLVAGLTPLLGAPGALLGVILSGVFLRVYSMRFNSRVLGLSFKRFFPTDVLVRLLLAAVALGGGCFVLKGFFSDSRVWFLVCGCGFSLFWWFMFLRNGSLQRLQNRSYVPQSELSAAT